jgi:uncharacterized protein
MIILITGGTGLIGSLLSKALISRGHEVRVLSRSKKEIPGLKVFTWDYTKNFLESGAFDNVEVLVHLAGEGIADSRWTIARKTQLISSRVDSLIFLSKFVPKSLHTLIGGSATGYYGGNTGETLNTLSSPAGNDFLSECTKIWEKTEDDFAKTHNLKLSKIRTGVVMSKNGGALPKLIGPIKAYIGSPLGSGKQWVSWIHEADLVRVFVDAIENPKSEIINAVSPYPATNEQMLLVLAKVLKKPAFMPNVPGFILKIILGEMAMVVLGSAKVQSNVPKEKFEFPNFKEAAEDLLMPAGHAGHA